MAIYKCSVCDYIYDEEKEGVKWEDLPDDWVCPVCESDKSYYEKIEKKEEPAQSLKKEKQTSQEDYERKSDDLETTMSDIHLMAETGNPIIEPMRTKKPDFSWDDILIKGAQLAKLPLNNDVPVNLKTVIGPNAAKPLIIDSPVIISHMSFGALSKEAKIALAKGSSAVKTAVCSGEGGILPEEREAAYAYIFEYIPNLYSATPENLKNAHAIEIKFGQSAKPGMGGHLPGKKVTEEIARLRGFKEGQDIISPAHFKDITNKNELKKKIEQIRELSEGRPVGIKLAAGHIEEDLEIALYGQPDFITIDGRAGATAAAPKYIKQATSVPTIFALFRAKHFFEKMKTKGITLIITGGLRISPDIAKALALGADVVALATSALMACGCQQYRICNTGKCPMGITTHNPELRARFNIKKSANGLTNFLKATNTELEYFSRLTGNTDIHNLSITDLCTTNSEISNYTNIEHV